MNNNFFKFFFGFALMIGAGVAGILLSQLGTNYGIDLRAFLAQFFN